jgi:hypothetical protein
MSFEVLDRAPRARMTRLPSPSRTAADSPRRRTLLILLFIPAFFSFYGFALNFDIHHVALAVAS